MVFRRQPASIMQHPRNNRRKRVEAAWAAFQSEKGGLRGGDGRKTALRMSSLAVLHTNCARP